MNSDNIFESLYIKVESELLKEAEFNKIEIMYQIGKMFLRELSYYKNTEKIQDKIPKVIQTLEQLKKTENPAFAGIYLNSIAIFMKNVISFLKSKGEDTSKIESHLKDYNANLDLALHMVK